VVSKGGLRVLVVEDDAFTRMTLVTVVTSLGHEVTGQAGTVVDAMDEARTSRPDVVLLDLDLGAGPTGIDAAYGLRGLLPDVGIVVLSSYADARVMGRRARPLPPGALFVSKRDLSDVQVLEDAIRGSLQADSPVAGPRGGVDFTDSQLELMRLVASGLSNDEIARRLWLTEPSVRRSITRLLRKLNIESSDTRNARVQLTRAYSELAGQVVRDE
jgi:DNA-binding NarL/FixJ family response regulator